MGHTLVTCSGEVNLKNELNEWGLTLCHSIFSKNLPWNCYGCEDTPSTFAMTTWRFINASYISIGCICFRTHSVFPAFRRNRLHANTQSIIFLCHLLWHPEICMVREYAYMLMSSLSIVKYFAYKLAPVPYRNMYIEDLHWKNFLFVASLITYYWVSNKIDIILRACIVVDVLLSLTHFTFCFFSLF